MQCVCIPRIVNGQNKCQTRSYNIAIKYSGERIKNEVRVKTPSTLAKAARHLQCVLALGRQSELGLTAFLPISKQI